MNRQLPALFVLDELLVTPAAEPLLADFWLPDIEVMGARSEAGSSAGLYLAAKGGHNDESHNHNDVGNFIVYADGRPVLIDVGAGVYTAKTFSEDRYTIWNMKSAYHNVPTINGVLQKNGRQWAAKDVRRFDVTFEPILLEDERLRAGWGDRLTRMVFTSKQPRLSDTFTITIRP